jgi:hypothetical protein
MSIVRYSSKSGGKYAQIEQIHLFIGIIEYRLQLMRHFDNVFVDLVVCAAIIISHSPALLPTTDSQLVRGALTAIRRITPVRRGQDTDPEALLHIINSCCPVSLAVRGTYLPAL